MTTGMGRWIIPLALGGLAACSQPEVRFRAAPRPSQGEAARLRQERTRVLAVEPASIFPRILDLLMDQGYLVRSVDERLGFVAFFQQWRDPSQGGANLIQEGTLLFTPMGDGSTKVRVMLTGSSQRLQGYASVRGDGSVVMLEAVRQDVGAEECLRVLDLVEQGLNGPPGG